RISHGGCGGGGYAGNDSSLRVDRQSGRQSRADRESGTRPSAHNGRDGFRGTEPGENGGFAGIPGERGSSDADRNLGGRAWLTWECRGHHVSCLSGQGGRRSVNHSSHRVEGQAWGQTRLDAKATGCAPGNAWPIGSDWRVHSVSRANMLLSSKNRTGRSVRHVQSEPLIQYVAHYI